MGHTTAKDLQHSFSEKLKSFSAPKLLQIGMDSPNVNFFFMTNFVLREVS